MLSGGESRNSGTPATLTQDDLLVLVENVPDGIAGPGDAVAEAVGSYGELDRDEGAGPRECVGCRST